MKFGGLVGMTFRLVIISHSLPIKGKSKNGEGGWGLHAAFLLCGGSPIYCLCFLFFFYFIVAWVNFFFQFVGDPVLYIQQFILVAHVSPWRPHLQSNMVIKEALKPAFQITKFITDFQYQHGYVFYPITRTVTYRERLQISFLNTAEFHNWT